MLALMALVRATNPAMLRPGPDGVTVDFESLQSKTALTGDERVLMKLRAAMEPPAGSQAGATALDLDVAEAQSLSAVLERLEKLQPWPEDVLKLSRSLRARLSSIA